MEIPLEATVRKEYVMEDNKLTNELVTSFTCSCGGVRLRHITCLDGKTKKEQLPW